MIITLKDIGRFESKYWKGKPDECWNWLAGLGGDGYGMFKLNGVNHNSSRVAYQIENGVFDYNLNVLHTCDNRQCVNAGHLFLGSQGDNIRDMFAKGRDNRPYKLSDEAIIEIVTLYGTGNYTQERLGLMFKVHPVHISRIIRGYRQ